MTIDYSHFAALSEGLAHERARLACAKTAGERQLRSVWVAQRERELSHERTRLGMADEPADMTDEELLAELGL